MSVLSRERMLETLLELGDRSRVRSREDLVASALRCALLVTDAAGAVAVAGQGRRSRRTVLRPGEADPARLDLLQGESALARTLGLHAHPVVIADLRRARAGG